MHLQTAYIRILTDISDHLGLLVTISVVLLVVCFAEFLTTKKRTAKKKRSLLLTENNILYLKRLMGAVLLVLLLFSRFLSRKFIVIRPHPFLFSAAVSVVSVQNFPPAMKATLLLLLGGYLSAAFM